LEFFKIKNIPVVKRINQPVKITDKIWILYTILFSSTTHIIALPFLQKYNK
jgi:hypothetical protein